MGFLDSYSFKRKIAELKLLYQSLSRRFRLKYLFFQEGFYDVSASANPWLRGTSILLTLLVFVSVGLPYLSNDSNTFTTLIETIEPFIVLAFGILYFIRLILASSSKVFIRSHWLEGLASILALFLGLDLIYFDGINIREFFAFFGFKNASKLIVNLVQAYLLVFVGIKIIQFIPRLIATTKNPARLIMNSFFLAIICGAILLTLPSATTDGDGLAFIDALFMSSSAVCVTGLAVVDTAVALSTFGQTVILVLIQIGGIGVITFATFLALFISEGIGVSQRQILQEVVSESDVSAVTRTLKQIIGVALIAEIIGVIGFYFSWTELIPNWKERLFFSVFHSVSAFCNAGFSLFSNSFADPINATSWSINGITIFLIVLGGLGFTVIWELVQRSFPNGKRLSASRRLSVHTIISLRMTAILITCGFVFILLLEWNSLLAQYSIGDKILVALFQSVTTRTAGFNTIDFGAMSIGATLIVLVLMSIGGSPASTAGGIKTTTIYVLIASMFANIKGKDRLEIAQRTIPNEVIFRAISSVILALFILISSTIILAIYEPFDFMDLLFEQVSAFMTVGLSRGITADLGNVGKSVIIVSMFLGRVGLLTFAFAFATKSQNQNYRYPEETIMVA